VGAGAPAEQEVAESIRKDVSEGMERQQREFLLRQQLAAVQKELRELAGGADDEPDLRARVEAAELPDAVRTAAVKELDRMERTSEQSPEGGWIRTWLETVLEMPWGVRTADSYDVPAARTVLDADHAGLADVKERITEYLAVRKRREDRGLGVVGGRRSGAVLALVGPPGVGKTSLGESGPARWAATSCGSPSAGSATRPRSAGTGVPTSARCRAGSCGR